MVTEYRSLDGGNRHGHVVIKVGVINVLIYNQLASSLLTTCGKLVIIKSEQTMRTDSDIGLITARLSLTAPSKKSTHLSEICEKM